MMQHTHTLRATSGWYSYNEIDLRASREDEIKPVLFNDKRNHPTSPKQRGGR